MTIKKLIYKIQNSHFQFDKPRCLPLLIRQNIRQILDTL